jgi:hypothetical protein
MVSRLEGEDKSTHNAAHGGGCAKRFIDDGDRVINEICHYAV